jgi:hypothetical protein
MIHTGDLNPNKGISIEELEDRMSTAATLKRIADVTRRERMVLRDQYELLVGPGLATWPKGSEQKALDLFPGSITALLDMQEALRETGIRCVIASPKWKNERRARSLHRCLPIRRKTR